MNTKYPKLLRPITLAGLTLKNRIFSAPTSLSELGPDTKYTREGIEYYKLRAAGGAAVVCVGEVIVDLQNGKSHPEQIGIDDPKTPAASASWWMPSTPKARRPPLNWTTVEPYVHRNFWAKLPPGPRPMWTTGETRSGP